MDMLPDRKINESIISTLSRLNLLIIYLKILYLLLVVAIALNLYS